MAMSQAEYSTTASQLGLRLGADILAATTASLAITPAVCLVDSTIMLRAATGRPFSDCLKTFVKPVSKLSRALLLSVPVRLVFGVYLGTYATANSIDTFTNLSRCAPSTEVTASTHKFVGTAVVSTGLTLYKDGRMAQFLGLHGKKTAIPALTYCLFATRDAITVFASFNLPTVVAPRLAELAPSVKAKLGNILQTESGRFKTAQFLLPAVIQFITTPIHLMGLDIFNRRDRLSFAARGSRVVKDCVIAVPARMVRIIPAFGMGAVVNASTRRALMEGL